MLPLFPKLIQLCPRSSESRTSLGPINALAFTAADSELNDSVHRHPDYRGDGARYRPEYDYHILGRESREGPYLCRMKTQPHKAELL